MSKRRLSVSKAAMSRSRSTGVARPMRTWATIGAKSRMIFCFSGWSSGMSRSAESTPETVGSRPKAACLRRSSSSESALASAVNPERPAIARIFRSQTTDSVPLAWRWSRL